MGTLDPALRKLLEEEWNKVHYPSRYITPKDFTITEKIIMLHNLSILVIVLTGAVSNTIDSAPKKYVKELAEKFHCKRYSLFSKYYHWKANRILVKGEIYHQKVLTKMSEAKKGWYEVKLFDILYCGLDKILVRSPLSPEIRKIYFALYEQLYGKGSDVEARKYFNMYEHSHRIIVARHQKQSE